MIEFSELKKIIVCDFDWIQNHKQYLIQYNGRYFEINYHVAELLNIIKSSNSINEVSEKFRGSNNKKYTVEELNVFIKSYLYPTLSKQSKYNNTKSSLLFSIELITKEKIEKISSKFKFLFKKTVVISIIIIFLLFDSLFFINNASFLSEIGNINIYTFLLLISFLLLSSFVHELGHATACKYYNTEHGSIGFGVYLNFPVFYTDVSNIWKLPRKQRIVVNFSGIYFQSIMLIPLLSLYFISHNNILSIYILTININIFITLSPFFKYDGYWIISDYLRIANLRQKINELIIFTIKKIIKKDIKKPEILKIRKRERTIAISYTILNLLFFSYYFLYLIPSILFKISKSLPILFKELALMLSNNIIPNFEFIQNILSQSLFFLFITYLLFRLFIKPILKNVKFRFG